MTELLLAWNSIDVVRIMAAAFQVTAFAGGIFAAVFALAAFLSDSTNPPRARRLRRIGLVAALAVPVLTGAAGVYSWRKDKLVFDPRDIPEARFAAMVERLKPFAGQVVTLTSLGNLKEPRDFASRISDTLKAARWEVRPSEGFMVGTIAGVQVWIHPAAPPRVKDAADTLLAILAELGISAEGWHQRPDSDSRVPVDEAIGISIGTKALRITARSPLRPKTARHPGEKRGRVSTLRHRMRPAV